MFEPLGEPAVSLAEHLFRRSALAMLLPKARETHRRTELERAGVLATDYVDGCLETRFGFSFLPARTEPQLSKVRIEKRLDRPAPFAGGSDPALVSAELRVADRNPSDRFADDVGRCGVSVRAEAKPWTPVRHRRGPSD